MRLQRVQIWKGSGWTTIGIKGSAWDKCAFDVSGAEVGEVGSEVEVGEGSTGAAEWRSWFRQGRQVAFNLEPRRGWNSLLGLTRRHLRQERLPVGGGMLN